MLFGILLCFALFCSFLGGHGLVAKFHQCEPQEKKKGKFVQPLLQQRLSLALKQVQAHLDCIVFGSASKSHSIRS
jgi:hypothetical protein